MTDVVVTGSLFVDKELRVEEAATFADALFSQRFGRLGPTAIQGVLTVLENAELSGALSVAGHQASVSSLTPTLSSTVLPNLIDASIGALSTDSAGVFHLDTTGSTSIQKGDQLKLTFAAPYSAPPLVVVSMSAPDLSDLIYWVDAAIGVTATTTTMEILFLADNSVPIPSGRRLSVNYFVISNTLVGGL